jgi:UDP-N-acetylmuramyl pentapeptide phosphotransferase/UDP-N-acetylglucosamine-1-phosphate transferase
MIAAALPFAVIVWVLTSLSLEGSRRFAVRRWRTSDRTADHGGAPRVPCVGGVALFGSLLPALWLASNDASLGATEAESARWLGTAGMVAVGAVDDRWPLAVPSKILAQSAVCAVYVIVAPPNETWAPWLQLAFLLLIVNAFNVVDVMDGLSIVVGGIAALGL